jgi:hypothetical protein
MVTIPKTSGLGLWTWIQEGQNQCCGSMTFWCGSMPLTKGSGCGSGSFYFIIDLQDANKKLIFLKSFSAYYFLKVLLHHFSKVKSLKEVKKQ